MNTGFKQSVIVLLTLMTLGACSEDKAGNEENAAVVPIIPTEPENVEALPAKESESAICGCGGSQVAFNDLSPVGVSSRPDIPSHFKQLHYANQWLVLGMATKIQSGRDIIFSQYFSGFDSDTKRYKVLGVFSPFEKDLAEEAKKEHKTHIPVVYSGAYANTPEIFNKKLPDNLFFAYEFSSELGVQVILKRAEEMLIHFSEGESYDTESVQAMQINSYNPMTMAVLDTYQTDMNQVPDFGLFSLCGGGRLMHVSFESEGYPWERDTIIVVFNSVGNIVYNKYFDYKQKVTTNPIMLEGCRNFVHLEVGEKFRNVLEKHLIWDGNDFVEVKREW